MKKSVVDNKKAIIYILSLILCYFLFFFVIGEKGTLLFNDSSTFLRYSESFGRGSYSLYTNFLRTLRLIHGNDRFLDYVFIYQGIFATATDILLIEYIRKQFEIDHIVGFMMHLLMFLTYGLVYPGAVSSHFVATESISIPLFVLCAYLMIKYFIEHSYKSFILAMLLSILMYKTRPQLAIVLPLFLFFFMLREVHARINKKYSNIFWIGVLSIVILGVISVFVALFVMISSWKGTSNNTQMIEAITGKAICFMSEEDANLYSPEERDVYMDLYRHTSDENRLFGDFPKSIFDYEDIHVIINKNITAHENIMWDYYLRKQGDDGGSEMYRIRNLITATEISWHKSEFVEVVIRLMPSSLVASIFVQPASIRIYCYFVAFILYISSILIILYSLRRGIEGKYIIPLGGTLAFILVNAFAGNIVLYAMQRYVVYCMGIFYVTGLIILIGCYRDYIERKVSL